jgi:hypothetical protein
MQKVYDSWAECDGSMKIWGRDHQADYKIWGHLWGLTVKLNKNKLNEFNLLLYEFNPSTVKFVVHFGNSSFV